MRTRTSNRTSRLWTTEDIERFARPVYFGFTSSQVLMGIAAVTPWPGWGLLTGILFVALNFHLFAYVQNDVLDLPIDRTQPLRAADPLVSGRVSLRSALIFALAQVPLAFLATWWMQGGRWAYLTLATGFVCMTLYNLYGKRCPVPMVTDAVQGIAWGTLAIYASLLAGGELNALSFVAAGFGFGFLFLINGIHGGLRDLRNDYKLGCRTTAIFFGARPDDQGGVHSTIAVRAYAFFALGVYLAPATVALLVNRFAYAAEMRAVLLVGWALLAATSIYGLWLVTAPSNSNRKAVIGYQTLPMLLAPLILFLPRLEPTLIAIALICFFVPFPIFDHTTKSWIANGLGIPAWNDRSPRDR